MVFNGHVGAGKAVYHRASVMEILELSGGSFDLGPSSGSWTVFRPAFCRGVRLGALVEELPAKAKKVHAQEESRLGHAIYIPTAAPKHPPRIGRPCKTD